MISARLVALTQPVQWLQDAGAKGPEDVISYAARVSNPTNQENFDTAEKLLGYCVRHKHWSVFEMANAIVEVQAPRDISRQLLRHRSFSFQEFSQRYAEVPEFCTRELRMQDTKNRQNSLPADPEMNVKWVRMLEGYLNGTDMQSGSLELYKEAVEAGVAKEVARVLLPEGLTMSTLYVNGTLRSWLHYLDVREEQGTQKEHRQLAQAIRQALEPAFPVVLNIKD